MTRRFQVLNGGLSLDERAEVAKRESSTDPFGAVERAFIEQVLQHAYEEPQGSHGVHFAGICWTDEDLEDYLRDEPELPWWQFVARLKRWFKDWATKDL